MRRIILCGGAMLLGLSGCAAALPGGRARPGGDMVSREKTAVLAAELLDFAEFFDACFTAAAEDISQAATTAVQRRSAATLRVKPVSRCRQMAAQNRPAAALLDTWTLCLRLREFLAGPDGRALFGELQPRALDAGEQALTRLEEIARDVIGEKRFAAVRPKLAEYVAKYPLRANFTDGGAPTFVMQDPSRDALAAILGIPLLPFQALGGIGAGATGISEIPGAADRFTEVVRGLPEDARAQLELLIHQLDDDPLLNRTVASVEQVAAEARRLVTVAEALPAQTRGELEALLASLDERETAARRLLEEARHTVRSADEALARTQATVKDAEALLARFDTAGQTWTNTSNAVGAAIREIQLLSGRTAERDAPPAEAPRTGAPHDPAPGAEATSAPAAGPPFDINDYSRTADALTRSAGEVRAVIAELRGLLTDQDSLPAALVRIEQRGTSLVTLTEARARALADLAAWRGAQLIALAFGLALVYRVVAPRLGGRARPAA